MTESTAPTASTCRVVRSGDAYVGQQGFTYLAGLTGSTAGSRGICMTVATLPPGARAKAHLHREIASRTSDSSSPDSRKALLRSHASARAARLLADFKLPKRWANRLKE